ncbi:MAG TPA: ATP synthase subunit I [Mariprofundaceae bacterium]|nr:ATP synthase subunit I [Mariprofundaceae bacterium]
MLISSGDDGSNRARKSGGLDSQQVNDAASGRPQAGDGRGERTGRADLRNILVVQAAISCLGATIVAFASGWLDGLSLLYGAALMSANGLWLYRGIEQAVSQPSGSGQRSLYRSAVLRFVFLLLALALAFAAGLYLPWVAAGMLAAQAVVYVYGLAGVWRARSGA